jgi:tRNA (cytidine/uridine-2'-O-)-methyltransferase
MRLCANAGARLHLIEPLGFELTDTRLKRAGLDYREWAQVSQHKDLASLLAALGPVRIFACTTRGRLRYAETAFRVGDGLLFGPETRGLPQELLESLPASQRLRIPMRPENRSLNLSNAVAIVLYEAWRQQGFYGAV